MLTFAFPCHFVQRKSVTTIESMSPKNYLKKKNHQGLLNDNFFFHFPPFFLQCSYPEQILFSVYRKKQREKKVTKIENIFNVEQTSMNS